MVTSLLAAAAIALAVTPDTSADPTAQIKVTDTVAGKGAKAKVGDVVALNYSLTLQGSDKVVDSNKDQAPFAFRMDGKSVIPGFQEGILGMQAGGKRTIIVPPNKGYGANGAGDVIPPNSTLVFNIELLRIDAKDSKPKLDIKNVRAGTGDPAKKGESVAFHYVGTFLNGVKFDSSRDRNEPMTVVMGAGGLIEGFTKTLEGMKLNEVRTVTIPYAMGYGETTRGPIPGFSTLVFEIEVVAIKKPGL